MAAVSWEVAAVVAGVLFVLVALALLYLASTGTDSLGARPHTPTTGKFDARRPGDLFE